MAGAAAAAANAAADAADVAALSLRSPLQQELLGALLRRLDSFELHHAANLCSAVRPLVIPCLLLLGG